MTIIERIKDDLKKISSWPWRLADSGSPTIQDQYRKAVLNKVRNRQFVASCPQHISALVDYYATAEAWIVVLKGDLVGGKEIYERYHYARKKLEAQDD